MDANSLLLERRRDLSWAIRDHLNPHTLNQLQATNFDVAPDVVPTLLAEVTLTSYRTGLPTRMNMEITYLEGVEKLDVHTYYYTPEGHYKGHISRYGVRVGELDNFFETVFHAQRNITEAPKT